MMQPRLLLGLLALVATAMPAPVPAAQQEQERMGRLFFTPAQRSSLDVARGQRARTTLSTETDQQEAAPVSQSITYGGLIRRDDGRTTVWLNNQAVRDTDPASAGAVVTRVRPDGRITLQAPQSSRSVELKPGQSVELLSGTIEEGYSRRALSEPKPKPGAKPAADARKGKPSPSDAARATDQEREERQQQIIEDAVSRAITDTAAARPGAPMAPAPPPQGPAR